MEIMKENDTNEIEWNEAVEGGVLENGLLANGMLEDGRKIKNWETINKRDKRLVALAKKHDEAALIRLIQLYEPMIKKYKYCGYSEHTRSHIDIEDKLWETFLNAIRSYDLNGEIPFTCHIYNKINFSSEGSARDFKRLCEREAFFTEGEVDEEALPFGYESHDCVDTEQIVWKRIKASMVDRVIAQLSPRDKALIYDHYFRCKDIMEIAAEAGVSLQAVYQQRQRVLAKLKKAIIKKRELFELG